MMVMKYATHVLNNERVSFSLYRVKKTLIDTRDNASVGKPRSLDIYNTG